MGSAFFRICHPQCIPFFIRTHSVFLRVVSHCPYLCLTIGGQSWGRQVSGNGFYDWVARVGSPSDVKGDGVRKRYIDGTEMYVLC